MTYIPTAWIDGDCVMAADMNHIEHGIDIAQGDVMVLRGVTAGIPATDPELVGRLYIETDLLLRIWRDNGAGWDLVPTGAVAAEYVRYFWQSPQAFGSLTYSIFTANYVFLVPIDIPYAVTVDQILWWTGNAIAGNVRCAIYAEGAADTPAGGALLVESGSIAVASIYNCEVSPIVGTSLAAGQYYLAYMGDNAACSRNTIRDEIANFAYQFNPHVYGAFPNPCPAVTLYNRIPNIGVRVASIP